MDQVQIQEIRLEFSRWVQGLRIRAGLNLHNAAARLGETRESLKGLENGNPIPLDRLARLVELYQVPEEEFFQKIFSVQKKHLEA